ncbi:MAG: hypothetical protein GXP25_23420 [Planctomycetes bacterium]|nr:hypothetical protein [Planctomycetota bacterium]
MGLVLTSAFCFGQVKNKSDKAQKKAEKKAKAKLASQYHTLTVAVAKYLTACEKVCKAWDSGYDVYTFKKYLHERDQYRKRVREAAKQIPKGDENVSKVLQFCDHCSELLDKAGGPGDNVLSHDEKAELKKLRRTLKSWRPVLKPPKNIMLK